ncbi:STAS domain-containing protein [Pseudonocardia hierapolitana]|uniref:STAS domain-containing protein n=1 Tax=Pseudonocardia hierapolitana TaxID=1128676 RepID=UPI001478DE72|nr:hypothetical protein [Pseudonocardia hierapolitana]
MQPENSARDRSGVRIMSVQPDRDHAFVEVIGVCGDEGVAELRQRVDGLLIGGARFVLVDLTGAGEVAPSTSSALAAAGRQLTRRQGWLRTVGPDSSSSAARYEASLLDLFTMYRAAMRMGPGMAAGAG